MLWITSQKHVRCYLMWYNTPLNAALLVQKRKPETRGFCGLPKPGFRVWQNVRVSPGPGFFKTWDSVPSSYISCMLNLICNHEMAPLAYTK